MTKREIERAEERHTKRRVRYTNREVWEREREKIDIQRKRKTRRVTEIDKFNTKKRQLDRERDSHTHTEEDTY